MTEYVYRRAMPRQVANGVDPDLFLPSKSMLRGLSVYASQLISPYSVFQLMIDDWRSRIEDEKCVNMLDLYPDVETAIRLGCRLIKISVSDINTFGFELDNPDVTGHLNISGDREKFKMNRINFVNLITLGSARILTADECLNRHINLD